MAARTFQLSKQNEGKKYERNTAIARPLSETLASRLRDSN
jgi:hypothetical protein